MSDLRTLYQEVIFDHNRNPRNYGKLADANRTAEGYNPLCGDRLTVYLKVSSDGLVEDASFEGQGCAISTASASLMTESVKGKTVAQAERMFEQFHAMVTKEGDVPEELGKLAVLSGVREYPVRVKCATLCWHTVHAALEGKSETASTE